MQYEKVTADSLSFFLQEDDYRFAYEINIKGQEVKMVVSFETENYEMEAKLQVYVDGEVVFEGHNIKKAVAAYHKALRED